MLAVVDSLQMSKVINSKTDTVELHQRERQDMLLHCKSAKAKKKHNTHQTKMYSIEHWWISVETNCKAKCVTYQNIIKYGPINNNSTEDSLHETVSLS